MYRDQCGSRQKQPDGLESLRKVHFLINMTMKLFSSGATIVKNAGAPRLMSTVGAGKQVQRHFTRFSHNRIDPKSPLNTPSHLSNCPHTLPFCPLTACERDRGDINHSAGAAAIKTSALPPFIRSLHMENKKKVVG